MNNILHIILGVIIIGLCVLCGVLIFKLDSARKNNAELSQNLAYAEQSIANQNAAIKQKELDLQKYKSQQESLSKSIKARYENITAQSAPNASKSDKCEAELAQIKRAIDTFYTTSHKLKTRGE